MELMGVLAVILVILGLVAPLGIGAAARNRFVQECSALESFLRELQRGAQSTRRHCFVGFAELPSSGDTSRDETELVVVACARTDGLAGYWENDPRASWVRENLSAENSGVLRLLAPAQRYPSLRLASSLPPPPHGAMNRPPVSRFQRVGHPSADSVTPLEVLVGGVQRSFRRVIHLRPDGGSKVVHQTTAGELVHFVEVGLIPRGGISIAAPEEEGESPVDSPKIPGLHGAIQICGITGRVRLYLP